MGVVVSENKFKDVYYGGCKEQGVSGCNIKDWGPYIVDVLLYVKNRLTSDIVLQSGDFQAKDGRLGIVPVILHHANIAALSTI